MRRSFLQPPERYFYWRAGHIHSNSDTAIGHVHFIGKPRGAERRRLIYQSSVSCPHSLVRRSADRLRRDGEQTSAHVTGRPEDFDREEYEGRIISIELDVRGRTHPCT